MLRPEVAKQREIEDYKRHRAALEAAGPQASETAAGPTASSSSTSAGEQPKSFRVPYLPAPPKPAAPVIAVPSGSAFVPTVSMEPASALEVAKAVLYTEGLERSLKEGERSARLQARADFYDAHRELQPPPEPQTDTPQDMTISELSFGAGPGYLSDPEAATLPAQGTKDTSAWTTADGRKIRVRYLPKLPQCPCVCPQPGGGQAPAPPFYSNLGSFISVEQLKGHFMSALKTDREEAVQVAMATFWPGALEEQCPEAEDINPLQIVQRESQEERLCVVATQSHSHLPTCEYTITCRIIVEWDFLTLKEQGEVYNTFTSVIPHCREDDREARYPTAERKKKTKEEYLACGCQGHTDTGGGSFSFGCFHQPRYAGCKWSRSLFSKGPADLFKPKKLTRQADQELAKSLSSKIETTIHHVADMVSPRMALFASQAYSCMVQFSAWSSCRLGDKHPAPYRPLASCTVVSDFTGI